MSKLKENSKLTQNNSNIVDVDDETECNPIDEVEMKWHARNPMPPLRNKNFLNDVLHFVAFFMHNFCAPPKELPAFRRQIYKFASNTMIMLENRLTAFAHNATQIISHENIAIFN